MESANFRSSTFDVAKHFSPSTTSESSHADFTNLLLKNAPDGITAVYMHCENAINFAVQLACIHTRRTKILCVRSSYRDLVTFSSRKYDLLSSEAETLGSLIKLINKHSDSAAVIVELLGVSFGLYEPELISKELCSIEELCSQNGIVFVVDETQTFGGYIGDDLFVSNHFGLSPGIICIGKCYGIHQSINLCQDQLKALVDGLHDSRQCVSAEAILALKSFSKSDQVVQSLEAFEEGAQNLKKEFNKKLRIRQVGFFLSITRQNGEFLDNWTKRICELSLNNGLLIKNNFFKSVLLIPSYSMTSETIKLSYSKLSQVLQQAENELQQPSLLYGDIIKNGISPTLLTRIKKRPPVVSQWEYVGALLAEIDSRLFVRKIDAEEQVSLIQGLRNVGIPAAEVVVMPGGFPEYAYLPGVSMETYMIDHVDSNPGMINGLVLRHQQYVEMAHDSGLNIPDRWPGNTIIWNGELTLIDFDLVYCQSEGNSPLLFAFEEVCSTFQCVSWVKNPKLQQDISDRLCLAVITRTSLQLVSLVWKGMVKFYGNPKKPYLPESLTPVDYRKGIDVMNLSFAKLGADEVIVKE